MHLIYLSLISLALTGCSTHLPEPPQPPEGPRYVIPWDVPPLYGVAQ